MTKAVNSLPLTADTGFEPWSVYVGFVIDKVARGQGFSPRSSVSPVYIIPLWLSTLICHVGVVKNRPFIGRI